MGIEISIFSSFFSHPLLATSGHCRPLLPTAVSWGCTQRLLEGQRKAGDSPFPQTLSTADSADSQLGASTHTAKVLCLLSLPPYYCCYYSLFLFFTKQEKRVNGAGGAGDTFFHKGTKSPLESQLQGARAVTSGGVPRPPCLHMSCRSVLWWGGHCLCLEGGSQDGRERPPSVLAQDRGEQATETVQGEREQGGRPAGGSQAGDSQAEDQEPWTPR